MQEDDFDVIDVVQNRNEAVRIVDQAKIKGDHVRGNLLAKEARPVQGGGQEKGQLS